MTAAQIDAALKAAREEEIANHWIGTAAASVPLPIPAGPPPRPSPTAGPPCHRFPTTGFPSPAIRSDGDRVLARSNPDPTASGSPHPRRRKQ